MRCLIGWHDYYISRRLSARAGKVGCRRCTRAWAIHWDLHSMVRWSPGFEEFYAEWARLGGD